MTEWGPDVHELATHWAREVELIDHHGVEWERVRQARYWLDQRFVYRYPGDIRDLRQRLIVVPPDQYGDQRLVAFHLEISEPTAGTTSTLDAFGNRVLHVEIPRVENEVAFHTRMIVERRLDGPGRPRLDAREARPFRAATPLTEPDSEIALVADQLARRHADAGAFAAAVSAWVFETMRYGHGSTDVETTAAQALRLGHGLCQDYAHIMLAICRAAGLPARYVSGHMLGEGGSHAWVEVLLRDRSGDLRAVAFDPTNHRRSRLAYVTVAVGRDYRDVSPTSGSFVAPYAGQLVTTKRAGVTDLEYH